MCQRRVWINGTGDDFPQVVTQPSIWIGDTAATMDMTPHDMGMVNKLMSKDSVSIVMGNKQVEKSIVIGNIPSVVCDNQGNQKVGILICDNQGNQKVGILMREVALVPDYMFNLFSISMRLKKGWKFGWPFQCLDLEKSRWEIQHEI